MNRAIRSIEAKLGSQPADSSLRNLHPDLKADYILANPPFNISDWSGKPLTGGDDGESISAFRGSTSHQRPMQVSFALSLIAHLLLFPWRKVQRVFLQQAVRTFENLAHQRLARTFREGT